MYFAIRNNRVNTCFIRDRDSRSGPLDQAVDASDSEVLALWAGRLRRSCGTSDEIFWVDLDSMSIDPPHLIGGREKLKMVAPSALVKSHEGALPSEADKANKENKTAYEDEDEEGTPLRCVEVDMEGLRAIESKESLLLAEVKKRDAHLQIQAAKEEAYQKALATYHVAKEAVRDRVLEAFLAQRQGRDMSLSEEDVCFPEKPVRPEYEPYGIDFDAILGRSL